MTSPPHLIPFIIFIFLTSGVTSQQFSTSEQTTLLNLKQSWGNPPLLSNWNSTSSPCTWTEIQCRNGSVIVLHLSSKELTGKIPPFISDLRNLESMLLHDNFLTGEFPKVFYNCSKLTELDISQNIFVGTLPDDIDKLTKLETVEFGGNNFTGDIPPAIGNLTALKTLLLYQNLFNGSIPPEIGNLSNLEKLGLPYNEFADPVIPIEFGKLNNLKVLWMPGANLVGKIPESLTNLDGALSLRCHSAPRAIGRVERRASPGTAVVRAPAGLARPDCIMEAVESAGSRAVDEGSVA